jgi:hypothetical protein
MSEAISAQIPLTLSRWIAAHYYPREAAAA